MTERMSDEDLDRMRKWVDAIGPDPYQRHTTGADACDRPLKHIEALRSDLRAAQTVPGDVEVSAAINSLLNYDDEDPQGPYDAKLASLITRLASAERAARERAEKAEAAAQAEVMASGRAVVKMSVEALRNRLVAAESTIATLRAQVDRARGALSSSLSFIESEMRYTQPTYDSGEEPADKFTYDAVPTCMEIRDALSTLEQKP